MTGTQQIIPRKVKCVRHFLYFPAQELADAAGKILRHHGRGLEIRPSGYNSPWLLLICENDSGEQSFMQSRTHFEEVAESFGGEYDGWECEIRNMIH
jgi:hypothetical protein